MIELSLSKANRIRLARAFRNVPRVDLSIQSVIEGQMGRAYVDDLEEPTAYKIAAGPFFYFAGEYLSPGGWAMLSSIKPYDLFMPSAPGWLEGAKSLFSGRLASTDRYRFSAENLSAVRLEQLVSASPFQGEALPMDLDFVSALWGEEHFVDFSEFDSPQDFAARGLGFYLERNGKVIGAAFSSLVCSRGIEISVYVDEKRRRQGVATLLSARLLLWCLERGDEPHWDAANPESAKLALKLGYTPTGSYRAYYLTEPRAEQAWSR